MTLNGVGLLFCDFSPNSIVLLSNYVTVIEDRPVMSVNIISQFQSSFWPNPPCSMVSLR